MHKLEHEICAAMCKGYREAVDKDDFVTSLRMWIHNNLSGTKSQPIDHVMWVPLEQVHANDYNPNSVSKNEMRLLYTSIKHDGYTQPIVTVYDDKTEKYVIVDGFHRFTTMMLNSDIQETTKRLIPIVVINKSINDRMASTVRHNRARGKHSVSGMSNMVFQMLDNGWSDEGVCHEIGCTAEELVRLKHITGFSKLFENVEYRKSWETQSQIKLRKEFEEKNANNS